MRTKKFSFRFITLFCAFLLISTSAYSQSKTGCTPTSNSLNCLEFNRYGTGITVGNNGTVYMSTNFGETWIQVYAGSINNLHKTSIANDNTFVVAGSNGTILLSTDMGETWETAMLNTTNPNSNLSNFLGVTVSAGGTGFAVGEAGAFFRTTDYGATWDQQIIGKQINLNSVSAYDDQNAIVVGDKNTIFFTSDGGDSWNIPGSSLSFQVNFKFVRVTDRFTAYATTTAGHILRTTDLGNTWTVLYADPLHTPLYRINRLSSGELISDGEAGTVLTSIDNGATWRKEMTGSIFGLYCLAFIDNMTGFAGGESGVMLRTDDAGKSWTPVDYSAHAAPTGKMVKAKMEEIKNFPNPFNPSTTISYSLPYEASVSLRVYDMLGRQVAVLVNAFEKEGPHTALFNASGLASGIYFYKLSIASGQNKTERTMRMILTK